ncbi:Malonyl CoA-acyl carrier protein transacylase [Pseudomonas chlororaphis]|uniref:SGNH/GDSL hydrolase family protein n=1 Tax=Pseudomonas chlororaphis TaxID=587753 RepID=UPI000F58E23F|nr:SGNH/GDSL hydrolase family protein [Pseudomonas chlororaphis]AZD06251.1 Malonyl CoA-acyl carrier protein transacylase [Pseudomonas chlororaphis]
MRYFVIPLLFAAAIAANADNGPDGVPIEENFQACTNLDCGASVVSKFHTDRRSLSGPTVFGETFYAEEGRSDFVRTMFAPTKVRLVYNPTTGQIFKPMTDYIPTKEGIKLTADSAIKRAPRGYSGEITEDEKKNYGVRVTPGFQDFQYAITYDKIQTFVPKAIGNLGGFRKAVGNVPLSITFFGDSITVGANATSIYTAPNQPGYTGLVMAYLNNKYPAMFESRNNAVGGWSSINAVSAVEYRVNDKKSDLVVLAFGMNDGGVFKPDEYKKNMQTVISAIRTKQPRVPILLVAPTRANPLAITQKRANITGYSPVFRELARDNASVAVADMTAAWDMMMSNKNYLDVTGNGLNHPNDFGHRILAEVVLSAILGKKY